MSNQNENEKVLAKVVSQLANLVAVLLLVITALSAALYYYFPQQASGHNFFDAGADEKSSLSPEAKLLAAKQVNVDTTHYWQAPDEASLAGNKDKELILYGKDIVANTAVYFGDKGKVAAHATNGMNCQNCHLNAGTKVFGNNYSAVASTYPKYRARSGSVENVYKRINDCFERSLNGKALDTQSKEMQAIAAYINWLGKNVAKGAKAAGSGLKDIAFLDRAADPAKGQLVYAGKCQSCHQSNGGGLKNSEGTAYTYPPLWGEHSYNDGAGLYRVSNFAKYVKSNMPLGTVHSAPQLTDEEAWDVAAYVNSQPRPKKDISKDWPKINEKPFDHPFGPYADGFNERQHKYGPYKPIKDKLALLQKK